MPAEFSLSRRKLLSLGGSLAATTLAGCGNAPLAKSVAAYWDQRAGSDPFTRAQVEQLPYATLAVKLGDRPRAMLVLIRVEGNDLHWITADKVVLVTRHGRLVKTVGLAAGNLRSTVMLDPDPLSLKEGWNSPRQWRRTVDLQPSGEFGTVLLAAWQPEKEEEIQTFNGPRKTIRIRESCAATHGRWALENIFWRDIETGSLAASVQTIVPNTPVLKLEPLKPYRGA